jgi:outer membrane protein
MTMLSRLLLTTTLAVWAPGAFATPEHAAEAAATPLNAALVKAYQTSPRLQARQAQVRGVDEQVTTAQAGWRPSLNGSGSLGYQQQVYAGTEQTARPRSVGLEISQPLLRLQTYPAIQAAKRAVDAARADLVAQEQLLLLDAVTAYLDLVRDEQVLKLRHNNEQVLTRQLTAARDRFRVGEITRTDVSQAESRLATATADRIQATGAVAATKANYRRVIGEEAGAVKQPETVPTLPANVDAAAAQAETANPEVIYANALFAQADQEVDGALAKLLPEISVVGSASRSYGQSSLAPERNDALVVGLRATVPLYQGGADYARTRQAKQTRSQRQLDYQETRLRAREAAVQAWQRYESTMAAITSRKTAVQANALALDGTEQEAKVGTRTTLDVLDAEQAYLTAQVNQVIAEHDAMVAAYQVRQATGTLTVAALQLPVTPYDPQQHYDANAGKWFGVGAE